MSLSAPSFEFMNKIIKFNNIPLKFLSNNNVRPQSNQTKNAESSVCNVCIWEMTSRKRTMGNEVGYSNTTRENSTPQDK